MKYDTIVYIGRFQPLHNAHIETLRRAANMADKIIVVIGSAYQPRTYKNPFTSIERELMVKSVAQDIGIKDKVFVEHVTDTIYNNVAWAARVQAIVADIVRPSEKVAIIGHDKDETTFYLKMFPQWKRENVELIEPLNATNIRDLYFRKDANLNFLSGVVPKSVQETLMEFKGTTQYQQIIREREFVENYKKPFAALPYEPIFVTVDAVVIQSGHVLMIKRRSEPGRGLWALPGGFVNASKDKSLEDAMLRELREETGIKVPRPVLNGCIKGTKVFDAIERSARGRTITHAFKVMLPDGELPHIKGADDAEKARWVPLAEVDSMECFEDHHEIIQWAIGG